jgi:hypothetical protein
VEQILEKSEGVFLYVERFCDDVQLRHLSLDRPEQFPQGLGGIFCQYFQRQFPDLDKFRKDVRPALRVILAARESLPVEILQRLFNWQDEELRDFTRPLASLFPVTTEAGNEVIKPYHKSLADWLTNASHADLFFVCEEEGVFTLAEFAWSEFLDGVPDMSEFIVRSAPLFLLMTGQHDRLEQLQGNNEFRSRREALDLTSDRLNHLGLGSLTMGRTDIPQLIRKAFLARPLMDEIHGVSYSQPLAVAICGPRTVGKTRAALEYSDCCRHHYTRTLMVDGNDDTWLGTRESHAEPGRSSKLESIAREMERSPKWLLIIDAVSEAQQLHVQRALQRINLFCDVLITSECVEWPDGITVLRLEGIPLPAAVSYLIKTTSSRRRREPDDLERAEEVAMSLCLRPLALEAACVLIQQHGLSFSEYLCIRRSKTRTPPRTA